MPKMEFDESKTKPASNRELLYQQVQEQSDVCDVTVQVGQWTKRFHWCVLVTSPFFDNIRRNDYIEKQTGLVKLDVATPLVTETAILFMYGKKPSFTAENVAAILELSEFLLLPNLKSACVSYLKTKATITEENCMAMLELSSLYGFEFPECYDFMKRHLNVCLQKKEAKRLTKESVLVLFEDPLLSYVTPEEKFAYAVEWADELKQNRLDFPEVFSAIDMGNVDGEFFKTVVLQHPLVTEMIRNDENVHPSGSLPDHMVLVFPGMKYKDRIACFDLETRRWCGVETKLPEDVEFDNNYNENTLDSAGRDSSEVLRVSNGYSSRKICIQNLHSNSGSVSSVSTPECGERKTRFSTYCLNGETFVAVARERKKTAQKIEQNDTVPLDLLRFRMLASRDPLSQLVLARECLLHRNVHIDTVTVFCGQIQLPETIIHPMLSMEETDVTSMCIGSNNAIGLLVKKESNHLYIYIYDASNCQLDVISLQEHLGSEDSNHGAEMKLTPREDGFICHNNKFALVISRLCGPTLTEKYIVQKVDLQYSRDWKYVRSFYNDGSWFRFLRRNWESDIEFARICHNELADTNAQEVIWEQLQCPKEIPRASDNGNVIAIKMPKSMLNCHFNCPHCEEEKLQKIKSSVNVFPRHVDVDDDYLYDDSDDSSNNNNYVFDDYFDSDDDYYYYSSD